MKAAFVLLAAWFVGAALEYFGGRIILPEMGLTPPGYWPWFWFTGLALLATVLGVIGVAVVDD